MYPPQTNDVRSCLFVSQGILYVYPLSACAWEKKLEVEAGGLQLRVRIAHNKMILRLGHPTADSYNMCYRLSAPAAHSITHRAALEYMFGDCTACSLCIESQPVPSQLSSLKNDRSHPIWSVAPVQTPVSCVRDADPTRCSLYR